jgi:hypothetical protein
VVTCEHSLPQLYFPKKRQAAASCARSCTVYTAH